MLYFGRNGMEMNERKSSVFVGSTSRWRGSNIA